MLISKSHAREPSLLVFAKAMKFECLMAQAQSLTFYIHPIMESCLQNSDLGVVDAFVLASKLNSNS